VTNNTVTVPAGASGTVTNSTAANCIVAGYATLIGGFNGFEAGPLEMPPNSFYRQLMIFAEASMKTGMAHGVLSSESGGLTLGTVTFTDSGYNAATQSRTFGHVVPSGGGLSETIRQLLFRTRSGQIWITYDERQRKDNGYQLTLNYTISWEPDLS
jgi:hypothetical protein